MLAVTKKTSSTNVYITKFVEFNTDTVKEAEKIFQEYRKKKIILNNSFNDPIWIMTNEADTREYKFEFSETLFHSQKTGEYNRQIGSYSDFVNAVKVYIIHLISNTSLLVMQQFLSHVKKIIIKTKFFNPYYSDDLLNRVKISSSNHLLMLIELANFIQFDDVDEFQEQCRVAYDELSEEVYIKKRGKKQQRQLAEFQSFFYFDKLLNQFWDFMATDKEKIMYYPVILWWKITNVLPLRPTELMVTPYDCLQPDDKGENILTIRRTKLKGHTKGKSKGIVTHKVDSDYTLHDYPVSKEIAELINDYKKRVKKFGKSKFLFSKKAYQESLAQHKKNSEQMSRNNEFSLRNFRVILARFYTKILHENFGLNLYYKRHHALGEDKVIFEDEDAFLKPNEIMMINVGDTRHFSMINMVLNDFNPILIKNFAGHEDINQSYHYFDHIDKIVKCMTHYKFNELRTGVMDSESIHFNKAFNLESIVRGIKDQDESFKEVDNGKCYSKKFISGDIQDCIPVFGDCFNCDFSKIDKAKDGDIIKLRQKELENCLREEGLLLQTILGKYNDTYDEYAEFQRIILRIQQATSEYVNLSSKLM